MQLYGQRLKTVKPPVRSAHLPALLPSPTLLRPACLRCEEDKFTKKPSRVDDGVADPKITREWIEQILNVLVNRA